MYSDSDKTEIDYFYKYNTKFIQGSEAPAHINLFDY